MMPSGAVVFLDRLVVFDRVESFGRKSSLGDFEHLMPIVLQALPTAAGIMDGRLFSVTEFARNVLSVDLRRSTLRSSWISWLERELSDGRLPGRVLLAVGGLLLIATCIHPEARQNLIPRLFALPGSGALMTMVRDFVDNWSNLTSTEQSLVLDLLKQDRPDRRLLQAVAITGDNVPSVIQAMLLGNGTALSAALTSILEEMPAELLSAAVTVYCGRPQPLWWIGTHHAGKAVWKPIIEEIGLGPDHVLFETALEDIIYSQDGARVAAIVRAAEPQYLDRLFELLLSQRIEWTGNYLSEAWALLFRRAPDRMTRSRWLARIAELAPSILDHLRDIDEWFTADEDKVDLLKLLEFDFSATLILHAIEQNLSFEKAEALKKSAVVLLESLLRRSRRVFMELVMKSAAG